LEDILVDGRPKAKRVELVVTGKTRGQTLTGRGEK